MLEINTLTGSWKSMPIEGIVAQELIEKTNGTFKIVKLQPGAIYPLHVHPDKTEYVYVLEGTLEATIEETKFVGETGKFFQFPVGKRHGLKNPGGKETILLVGAIRDEE